ncbi:MAG: ferrous iron transport protein A, partial [Nitrospinaceae bacterium]|nr:ferrous iron transport protein A [Nitrospinaceae bacterium]
PQGTPLTELSPGKLAAIVHVEDEPQAIHAELVAKDLHPGMRVRVLESGPEEIRFEADAHEYTLAPVVAANLSVHPVPEGQEMSVSLKSLADLKPGEKAEVASISPACRGSQRRRMLDLGIIPGTEVTCEMNSPTGDPTAYRIRGAVIALRREQSGMVQINEPQGVTT